MSNFKTMAIASIIAIVAVISAAAVAAQSDADDESELTEYKFFIDLGGTIMSFADPFGDFEGDYGDGSLEVVYASSVKEALTLACEQKFGYEGAIEFSSSGYISEINGADGNGVTIFPDQSFVEEEPWNHCIYLYPIQFVWDGESWSVANAPLGSYSGDETVFALITMPTSFGDDEYFTFDEYNGMYSEEGQGNEVYQYLQDVYGWTAGATSQPVFRAPFTFVQDGLIYEMQDNYYDVKVIGSTENVTGDIVIPDSINFLGVDLNVWRVGMKAFMDRDDITSVTLSCDIERHAFYKCDNLAIVTLKDGCEQIGKSAFAYCPALAGVTIPESVYYIGVNAFYGAHFYDENGEAIKANVDNLPGYTYSGMDAELFRILMYDYTFYIDLGGEIYNIVGESDNIYDYGDASWETATATDVLSALKAVCDQKFHEGALEISSSGAIKTINGIDGNGMYIFPDESLNPDYEHWIYFYPVQFVMEDGEWKQLDTYIGAYEGESTVFAIVLMPISFESEPIVYHFEENMGFSGAYYGDKVYKMFQDVYGWTYGSPSAPVFREIDVFELNNFVFQVTDADAKEVKVIASIDLEGEAFIPEIVEFRGEQYTVTRVGMKAFMDCDDITSVVVNCDIERHAFYKCDGIGSIEIGEKCEQIGKSAFAYCPSLTSVTMADSVSYLGVNAFYGTKFHDENGNSIKANVENLAGYKYIGENSDLYRVTYTFYIDLGGTISGFFLGTDENYGGPSTEVVCADNARNALIKACDQKFGEGSLELKKTKYGYSIAKINGMDGNGSGISSLENQYPPYPDVYYYPVQYVFEDTWKQAPVTIPNYMGPATTFAITFQPITFDEEEIEHTFESEGDAAIYDMLKTVYNWPGWGTFETPFISTQEISVEHSEYLALGDFEALEVTVGPIDCTNPNVTYFSTNENVAVVDDLGIITTVAEGYTEIMVFSNYDPSLSITLPLNVFSTFTDEEFIFEVMSLGDMTVKVIGYDGTPSEELFIPEMAFIGDYEFSVARVGMKAFMDCDEITTVVVACDIERHAFYKCDELENVVLMEGCKQIGKSAFAYCTDLEFIDFNGGITYIGVNAFYGIKFLDEGGNRLSATPENLAGHSFEGDDGVLTICPPVESTVVTLS